MGWIELPILFIDKPQEEIESDIENGIEYADEDYCIDWGCIKESVIVGFNKGSKENESTIRLDNGDSFRIALPYIELRKKIFSESKCTLSQNLKKQ